MWLCNLPKLLILWMLANFIIYLCWQRFGNIVRKRLKNTVTCKRLKYLYQQYNDSHFLFASLTWPYLSYELKAYNQSGLITTSGTTAEDSILLKYYFFSRWVRVFLFHNITEISVSFPAVIIRILENRKVLDATSLNGPFQKLWDSWSEIITLLITRHQ